MFLSLLRNPKGHLVDAVRSLRPVLRTSLRSSPIGANSACASNHAGMRSLSSATNDFRCCMLCAWLFNVCKRNQAETGKPSVEASGSVNSVPGSAYVRQAWQIKLPVGRIPNHPHCLSGRRQHDVFCQHSSLRRTRSRAPSCLKQQLFCHSSRWKCLAHGAKGKRVVYVQLPLVAKQSHLRLVLLPGAPCSSIRVTAMTLHCDSLH